MIYLASPYSHPEIGVRVERYYAAMDAVQRTGHLHHGLIYSPIAYWHPFATYYSGPTAAIDYKAVNEDAILASSAMWVLTLDGWRDSVGVKMEMDFCHYLSKPIKFLNPTTYELTDAVPA